MDTAKILEKINGVSVPKVKKCAIAYSGGLDSTLGIEMLRRVYKVDEIVAINVDVGQGQEEMDMCVSRAHKLKLEPVMIDMTKEFTEGWLKKAILANSDYNGYPVSTSMTRQLIAMTVAKKRPSSAVTACSKARPGGAMTNTGCTMSSRCSPPNSKCSCRCATST
jgi:argininosuccinate synthase